MIQPAALSLPIATPGRAASSPVGSGALFALPEVAATGAEPVAIVSAATPPVALVEAAPIADAVLLAGAGAGASDTAPLDPAAPVPVIADPDMPTANGTARQAGAAPGNALPPSPLADVRPVLRRAPAPPSILVVPDQAQGRARTDLPADGPMPDSTTSSDDRKTSEDPVDDAPLISTALPDAAPAIDRSITNNFGDHMPPPVPTSATPLADQPLPRPSTKHDTSPLPIVSHAAPLRSPAPIAAETPPATPITPLAGTQATTPLDTDVSTAPLGAADAIAPSRARSASDRPEAPPAISVLTTGAPVAAVEPEPDISEPNILMAMPTTWSRSPPPPSVAAPVGGASDVASPAPTRVAITTATTAPVLAAQTTIAAAVPARTTPAASRSSRASLAADERGAIAAAILPSNSGEHADPLSSPASPIALPLHWQRAYVGGTSAPSDIPVTTATEAAAPRPAASPPPVAPAIAASPPATPSAEVAVASGRAARAVEPATPLPVAPSQVAATRPLPPAAPAAPAAIVFGAARFAAQVAEDRDEPAPSITTAPLAAPVLDRAVALTAQAPLDVTREHWPHARIERIEMIRDAADAADTRIRLVPDALGAIDVEVRRDGDTLDVRFRADQPQTRALLADAAPRLADAAEARGLRLGQTSVGGDGSGQSQQPRQSLPAAPPRAPRSPVADAPAADDDTRLA